MSSFPGQFLRFVLKLTLGLFAAVFAVSLLAAALVVLVLSLLKSLITGKKPAPAMAFGRFQKFSTQTIWPGARDDRAAKASAADVVDVEVREIKETTQALAPDKRLP